MFVVYNSLTVHSLQTNDVCKFGDGSVPSIYQPMRLKHVTFTQVFIRRALMTTALPFRPMIHELIKGDLHSVLYYLDIWIGQGLFS